MKKMTANKETWRALQNVRTSYKSLLSDSPKIINGQFTQPDEMRLFWQQICM